MTEQQNMVPKTSTSNLGAELGIGATKHKDTKWEKFRNNFPKSSDQEYKRFNPYDIMMDALDKAANGKNGLDDIFLDLVTSALCMPFDQIKAICDFKRRKRQEKRNGTKAQKDYDKMISLINCGINLPEDEARKITTEYLKAKGFDVTKSDQSSAAQDGSADTEKVVATMSKAATDPEHLTEEEKKIVKDNLSKLGLDQKDVESLQDAVIDNGINQKGCEKLGELFGVKYEGDVDKLAADIGKKLNENPKLLDEVRNKMKDGVDTLVDAKTMSRHDSLRREIADMEKAEREAEKTGKTTGYSEDRLKNMLSEIGYDQEEIKGMKDRGQLNFAGVKACLVHEEKKMNIELAREATKEAAKTKASQQKTAPAQTKTAANTANVNTAAAAKRNNGAMR